MNDAVRLLTAHDLAEALQISTYHAYELIRRGVIPSLRIGRLVRVREQDLAKFLGTATGDGDSGQP